MHNLPRIGSEPTNQPPTRRESSCVKTTPESLTRCALRNALPAPLRLGEAQNENIFGSSARYTCFEVATETNRHSPVPRRAWASAALNSLVRLKVWYRITESAAAPI